MGWHGICGNIEGTSSCMSSDVGRRHYPDYARRGDRPEGTDLIARALQVTASCLLHNIRRCVTLSDRAIGARRLGALLPLAAPLNGIAS